MVETNIEIKFEEESTLFFKKIGGDNDDVAKEESSCACGKDRSGYEEGTDEVSENKEIKRANIEISVYKNIAFWPRTCLLTL